MCFSPYLGVWWGGGPMGLVHNLLMRFFQPIQLKNRSFRNYFFHIVITSNDHPRYVKHVLACIYVVLPYFGCVLLGVDSVRGGLAEGNRIFLKKNFTPFVYIQNHPRVMGIILKYVCWGTHLPPPPPPPPGTPAADCPTLQPPRFGSTKGRGGGGGGFPPPSTTPETVEHPLGSNPGWEQPPCGDAPPSVVPKTVPSELLQPSGHPPPPPPPHSASICCACTIHRGGPPRGYRDSFVASGAVPLHVWQEPIQDHLSDISEGVALYCLRELIQSIEKDYEAAYEPLLKKKGKRPAWKDRKKVFNALVDEEPIKKGFDAAAKGQCLLDLLAHATSDGLLVANADLNKAYIQKSKKWKRAGLEV